MFLALLERDKEEALRCSTRTLHFPDGQSRTIKTYRLVWRWYDHILAYQFAPVEMDILTLALKGASEENISVAEALGQLVEHIVMETEQLGGDLTDDDLENLADKKATKGQSH